MPSEPNLTWIIRRTRAHNVSCGVLAAGLQLRNEDNSLHPSILRKLAAGQSLKAYSQVPNSRSAHVGQ